METIYVPIDEIVEEENPFEPLEAEMFDKLVESIKEQGIIEPLHVTRKDGKYHLLQGYQRLRAAKEAGLEYVECILEKEDPKRGIAVKYDPNLYRRHLTKDRIYKHEQDKEKLKEELESQYRLIPELEYLERILPEELKETLLKVHEIEQRKFYNSLPVKYVEKAEEATKEAEESEKKVEEITDKIKKKDEEIFKLTEKIKKMEAEIKDLNLVKNAKKEELDKALAIEKKKIEEELKKKYSGNELAVKLKEEKTRLEAEYKKKLEIDIAKGIEEERKIAEKHSKEREKLKKQLEPLQEEVKQLKADLKTAEKSEAIARKSEKWATDNLQRLIRQEKMPETLELIAKELANIRGRVLVYTDTLLRTGDVVQEEREMNLKVIAKFKAELKNLNEASKTIIDLLVNGFPKKPADKNDSKSPKFSESFAQ